MDSSERTGGSSLCNSQDEEHDDFDDTLLLGGEPNLLDVDVERRGVRDILAALTDSERDQLRAFDMTMPIRHFRAEKGNVPKAIHQIKETLQWRIDFGVDVIVSCFQVEHTDQDTPAHAEMREILSRESVPGKIYARGYDTQGRAFMYMTPARENTNHELNNMRHLVFHLEKTIACTARKSVQLQHPNKKIVPLEKVNAIIDYEGFKIRNAPPMSTTQYTLDILQKHYPERMRHFYLLHPPFVFQVFWSMIKHFVDPVTKEKIVFCSGKNHTRKLLDHVSEVDKLEPRAYGSNPNLRPFDAEEYLRRLPFNVSFDEKISY
jgi:predicted Ser/Thr protein kinase